MDPNPYESPAAVTSIRTKSNWAAFGYLVVVPLGVLGGIAWRTWNGITHHYPYDLDTYALLNGAALAAAGWWILVRIIRR